MIFSISAWLSVLSYMFMVAIILLMFSVFIIFSIILIEHTKKKIARRKEIDTVNSQMRDLIGKVEKGLSSKEYLEEYKDKHRKFLTKKYNEWQAIPIFKKSFKYLHKYIGCSKKAFDEFVKNCDWQMPTMLS